MADPRARLRPQPSPDDVTPIGPGPIERGALDAPDLLGRALAGVSERLWVAGRWVPVAVVLAALVVGATIGWLALRPDPPPVEELLPRVDDVADLSAAGSVAAATSTTVVTAPVVVHAAGAVAAPGLYTLDPPVRVADVVAAAGGLTADADTDRVNLASPVADGERIYVPRLGEEAVPSVVVGTSGADGVGPAGGDEPLEPIDLNAADATELETLPGVGPVTAAAIIAHRTDQGPFRSVEALLEVRGIGPSRLEQLRPLVTVGS